MRNLKLANKLLVSFGGIALLLAGIAYFSILQLQSMNGLTDKAVNNRLPKLLLTQNMKDAALKFRVAEEVHILLNDDAGMSAQEHKMAMLRETVDNDFGQLQATVQVAEARSALQRFHDAWENYIAQNARVRSFSRAHQNDAATSLVIGPSQHDFDVMSQAADALTATETKLLKSAGTDAVDLFTIARRLLLVAVAFALLGLFGILIALVRQIAKPMSLVTAALGELAKGNMSASVQIEQRTDEVGELVSAMSGLRDQLAAAEQAKVEQTTLIVDSVGSALSRLAEGDLVSRIDAELAGPFAKLKQDFNQAAGALQQAMANIAEAAGGINAGASDIRQASDDLSRRTEQQAASLEETAAAMEELTSTVRSTAERAGQARAAAQDAQHDAEQSGDVVERAITAMAGIERASGEISEIISVIDGIAFQTNLLALNAGVEAARAGDAGKGFAVVASEVRALAQRSADAAKDVKSRIDTSSDQVARGVELVNDAGASLTRIVGRISDVNGLISEIASSAEQQSVGLQQINTAVGEMDGVTQQNAAMVEEATAAARSLAAEADEMATQIARFRCGMSEANHVSPRREVSDQVNNGRNVVPMPRQRAGGARNTSAAWSEF